MYETETTPRSYNLEVWWDEDDFFAYNTGWKVLLDGDMFEGPDRDALIREALDVSTKPPLPTENEGSAEDTKPPSFL